jgi:hypothetical protein
MILHLAFEAPQSIIEPNDKTASAALHLLDQLAQTDYGQQPKVIGNARFEIKHSVSTGMPLEIVTLPGAPAVDPAHTAWIQTVLLWTETIKPGMTRSDLLKGFTTGGDFLPNAANLRVETVSVDKSRCAIRRIGKGSRRQNHGHFSTVY